jgi:hypothetical protein
VLRMQRPPRGAGDEVDVSGLPAPVQRAIADVRRQLLETAAAEKAPAEQPARAAGSPATRQLDDRQVLEADAVRRRRLQQAFLRGDPASDRTGPKAGRGLWAGLALAVGLALAIGLAALIQATMEQQARDARAHRTSAVSTPFRPA